MTRGLGDFLEMIFPSAPGNLAQPAGPVAMPELQCCGVWTTYPTPGNDTQCPGCGSIFHVPGPPVAEPWAEVCVCYSCHGECGGGCGGPWRMTHRGLMCGPCSEMADVTDDEFTGAKVTISQDRVKLSVDTWGYDKSIWLDVADVDALMVALLERRHELIAARRADAEADARLRAYRKAGL